MLALNFNVRCSFWLFASYCLSANGNPSSLLQSRHRHEGIFQLQMSREAREPPGTKDPSILLWEI